MKVLHIIWNAKFGGIEKLVYELAEEQQKSELVTPTILISKEEGELLGKFKAAEFSTHFLHFKKGFDLELGNFKNAVRYFKKHDVLHFHFFNPILIFAAYLSKKKIVYTEHGNFGFGRKKKKLDGLLDVLKTRFLKIKKVSIVYNSNFTKVYAEKKYCLVNHPRSWVVRNGIKQSSNSSAIVNTSTDINYLALKSQIESKFVIGTSSRFAGFKRIDRLITSFSKLPENQNNTLLLVGDGELKEQLVKQVEDLNLQHQVIFTGYAEDVRSYQNLMDVCVFASDNEPFGLVAIETLSLGKPTIVFKSGGGLVEIIEGINKDDVVDGEMQLVERIEHYRNNDKGMELYKEERINYSKGYAINSVAEELVTIYQTSK